MSLKELLRRYAKDILNEKGLPPGQMQSVDQEVREERAAIKEYDGGLPREQAEREAGITK